MSSSNSRIIVALDMPDRAQLVALVEALTPADCRLKIGKASFTQYGPDLVRWLVGRGFDVFLDLKFHDIPETVAGAVRAAAQLGVWMVNVHASGGEAMLHAARRAIEDLALSRPPLLIAVTVLTSLSERDLQSIGMTLPLEQVVLRLAHLSQQAGCDGVVCSAQDLATLNAQLPASFVRVTPGIRLAGDPVHDQQRVMTPAAAFALGSHYLVMGRSITQAVDPLLVLRSLASL